MNTRSTVRPSVRLSVWCVGSTSFRPIPRVGRETDILGIFVSIIIYDFPGITKKRMPPSIGCITIFFWFKMGYSNRVDCLERISFLRSIERES